MPNLHRGPGERLPNFHDAVLRGCSNAFRQVLFNNYCKAYILLHFLENLPSTVQGGKIGLHDAQSLTS